jgi:hypothetical protein
MTDAEAGGMDRQNVGAEDHGGRRWLSGSLSNVPFSHWWAYSHRLGLARK